MLQMVGRYLANKSKSFLCESVDLVQLFPYQQPMDRARYPRTSTLRPAGVADRPRSSYPVISRVLLLCRDQAAFGGSAPSGVADGPP